MQHTATLQSPPGFFLVFFIGCGPSPLVLDKRNKLRQIARANQFLRETHEMEDDLNGDEIILRSSQPPKATTTEKDLRK